MQPHLTQPNTPPELDPGFDAPSLALRRYREAVALLPKHDVLVLVLSRPDGSTSRWQLDIAPAGGPLDRTTLRLAERVAKLFLWAHGGNRLWVSGSPEVAKHLQAAYRPGGARAFDAELMARAYARPFEVLAAAGDELPPLRDVLKPAGGHWEGCRLGFDLGASDFKLAAVRDGEPVFTAEKPWDPKNAADPNYHFSMIMAGLREAASHLPRVDAIGGSSAGIIVDNEPRVGSLFRSVPAASFDREIRPLFRRLAEPWGVPVTVLNDGDVTALAGALSLKVSALLGVALGSSEAAGYVNRQGALTGWLSELAFAPADLQARAACDEWSGDAGVGALYFSQQAVGRLMPAAGIAPLEGAGLPEQLKHVQRLVEAGDARAERIFRTIGACLGYTLPWYGECYDFDHLLILGRVTSGRGGELLLETARSVLTTVFSGRDARVELHVPDEQTRRLGQAVAAASLPEICAKVV